MKWLVFILALSPAAARADKGDLSAPAKGPQTASPRGEVKAAPPTDKRALQLALKK